jgi:hypothetical protein
MGEMEEAADDSVEVTTDTLLFLGVTPFSLLLPPSFPKETTILPFIYHA